MTKNNILITKNLKVYFQQKKEVVKAVDGVDIFLKEGLTTSLAGESGCGKTTLAKTILGFYKPKEGKVYFKGQDISDKKNERLIRDNIQIVFQNPFSSMDPRYTVFSTLYEALTVFKPINKNKAYEIIKKTLAEVELREDVMYRFPHQLSGGQIQRVCIARAIINKPTLVILDEPTSSLDLSTTVKIIDLLAKLQSELSVTFLFISHNLKLVKKISHYVFIMYYGKLVEYGLGEKVCNNPAHPYTKLLLEASKYKIEEVFKLSGSSFSGCIFKSRCPKAQTNCNNEPGKVELEAGHVVFCHFT